MEINGRFWGSLPVATRAGVPFASALYDLLVLARAAAPPRYTVGRRCRRLASDIEWLKEMARLSPDDRIVRRGLVEPASKGSLVRDVARLLSPAERYDVQMWRDPIPGAIDLLSVVREQAATVRRMAGRAATPLWSAAYRACFRQSALNTAARARRVLFICHGNIMRSAFAAAYLRQRAPATLDIEAASAGDYPRSGRPADPRMLDAARQWGVDLSGHRSRVVDAEMVRWADVILVMDRKNREALRHLPDAAGKVHFLGLLDPAAARVEIGDPYCGDDRAAATVCESIVTAVDELANRAARRVADERRDDARLRTPRGALR
jgi:protein-tyrosine-phosphatase